MPVGAYYQTHSTLTKAEIEIATNVVNGRWRTAYSNYEHEKIAEDAGGLPPDGVCEEEAEVLRDMERLIHEFHDNDKYAGHMLRLT